MLRWLPALLLLPGCAAVWAGTGAGPVVFETSLRGGTVVAGAVQGVGGTLVNRSRRPITNYGRGEITTVRLFRQSERPFRHADAPGDSSTALGPYWERAYHLAFAPEPGTVRTLELPFTVVEPGGRLTMRPVRFAWPRDPGTYTVSVCTNYALGAGTSEDTREVCARPVRVVVEAPPGTP